MKILVINCGSSSIKYKLYSFPDQKLILKGIIEKVAQRGSRIKNYSQGVKVLVADILKKGAITNLSEIFAIGHRVVHGGETFKQPHIVDARVIKKIKDCSQLAPLHNLANLAGIISCRKLFPKIVQVAVFDTAFYQDISEQVYLYALPYRYYRKYKIRKYGFHGTSHQFIAQQVAKLLKKPLTKVKLITCHLGNGCSITAFDRGRAVDTSMGFTPLEGLIMGTRSGDIDVAAVFHIMKKTRLSLDKMNEILNKKSGLLGVSGLSNDFRVIKKASAQGDKFAKLAFDMFIYRIRKYIGAYYYTLGGVDAICLTGGIGENSSDVLKVVKNDIIKLGGSKAKVLVIPTDEELMIARLTHALVKSKLGLKRRKK